MCDMEENPGPQPKTTPMTTRQTSRRSEDRRPEMAKDANSQPSLADVMCPLNNMNTDINRRLDGFNTQFDNLNDSVSDLREEVTQLTNDLQKVQEENELLKEENKDISSRLEEAKEKLGDLGHSSRNNLIISGLKKKTESEKETWVDCEVLVKDLIRHKLGVKREIKLERAHRLKGPNSPIIACFTSYKDKQCILRAKRKLKEAEDCSDIVIAEDDSQNVRDVREKQDKQCILRAKRKQKEADDCSDIVIAEDDSQNVRDVREKQDKQCILRAKRKQKEAEDCSDIVIAEDDSQNVRDVREKQDKQCILRAKRKQKEAEDCSDIVIAEDDSQNVRDVREKQDKQCILRAKRKQKEAEDCSDIVIAEDDSQNVRDVREKLGPNLTDASGTGKKTSLLEKQDKQCILRAKRKQKEAEDCSDIVIAEDDSQNVRDVREKQDKQCILRAKRKQKEAEDCSDIVITEDDSQNVRDVREKQDKQFVMITTEMGRTKGKNQDIGTGANPSSATSLSASRASSLSPAPATATASSSSASSTPVQTDQKIKDELKDLFTRVRDVQDERSRGEHNLTNISKTHERMQQESRSKVLGASVTPYYKNKLKGLYNTAMQDAETEAEMLRKAMDKITEIKALRESKKQDSKHPKPIMRRGVLMTLLQQNATTLPLWVSKPGEKPPPLCGAVPADSNYVCNKNDKIAARVKSTEGEENWILASVVSFTSQTNRYEVDDIDAEEGKERHSISRRRIVPLPIYRANPETDPEALFPKGTLVLALYPQTTCFYRGLVEEPPKTHEDDYSVLFEDTTYPEGYSPPLMVAQRYVIACKEEKKK
ncbi:hypothetical protein ACOMHN_000486 [Nucella lapillus]